MSSRFWRKGYMTKDEWFNLPLALTGTKRIAAGPETLNPKTLNPKP